MREVLTYVLMVQDIQLVRFLLSGGIGTVLHYVVFIYLTEWRNVWYPISVVVAFIPAFMLSFVLQKFWTFADTGLESMDQQAILYFGKKMVFLGANMVLLAFLVEYERLRPRIAQVIATIILGVFSFFVTRWIFST